MSLFLCPLCGKRNSLRLYDPTEFENDVTGVQVTGLGRGGGFVDIDRFSLLHDSHLTGLIAWRCRRILGFIEGSEPASVADIKNLRKANDDWAAWGKEARNTISKKDAEINRLVAQNRKYQSENNVQREQLRQSGPSIFQVENEQLHRDNSSWVAWGAKAEKRIADLDSSNKRLDNENARLKQVIAKLKEQIEESDDESILAVEMEGLLERINDSSNTSYDNLGDAIDWLLEQ